MGPEARDQSGQEGDLRKNGDGQGQTRKDHRQGLRSGGAQKVGLSSATHFGPILGVRQMLPAGDPREAPEVLSKLFASGGVHVAMLYKGVGLRQHVDVTK